MKTIASLIAVAGIAGAANADVTINELLGSTSGSDNEFIELYNTGASAVDLNGWSIELWDSDSGSIGPGNSDAGSPYALSGSIAAGGYWTIANALAEFAYGFTADVQFANNSIENSSYTVVLRDAGANVVESIFVTDGGAGDTANIDGTPITPDATFGPDGTFLPAGFYRVGDGNATLALLEFGQPSASATPGAANLPRPPPSPSWVSVVWSPAVVAANDDPIPHGMIF